MTKTNMILVVAAVLMLTSIGSPNFGQVPTGKKGKQPKQPPVAGKGHQPQVVNVASRVPGVVASLHVNVEQRVTKGQVLLRLDNRAAQLHVKHAEQRVEQALADVGAAKAVRAAAKAQYERIRRMMAITSTSVAKEEFAVKEMQYRRTEFDLLARSAARQMAQTELAQAKLQLDLHVIRAPAAGIVQRVLRPGEGVRVLRTAVWLRIDKSKEKRR